MSVTEVEPAEAEAEATEQDNGEVKDFEPTAADVRRAGAGPEALALPAIDGEAPDRIEVALSGTIRLDRSDPADVAFMRRLKLGQEVDVRVVGIVRGKNGTVTWDEDGYPGETTHSAKVRITTLFRPVDDDGAMSRVGSEQTELVDE